jgi:hypothetical protein
MKYLFLFFTFFCCGSVQASDLQQGITRLHEEIVRKVRERPELNQEMPGLRVFQTAVKSYCAFMESPASKNVAYPDRFVFVDFTRSALDQRLYIFDLGRRELLHQEYGTHGSGTASRLYYSIGQAEGVAPAIVLLRAGNYNESHFFSNRYGSAESSLGVALADEKDKHSASLNVKALRMKGLDFALNSEMENRGVVFHSWGYQVKEVKQLKMAPNSEGCLMFPAQDEFEGQSKVNVASVFIESIKSAPVFLYHDRLVNSELNEAAYQDDLRLGQQFRDQVETEVHRAAVRFSWAPGYEQKVLQKFQSRLEQDWFRKARETHRYFQKGSEWIGHEPTIPELCISRFE